LVVLPLEAQHLLKFLIIDVPVAHVYYQEVAAVVLVEEPLDFVDRIPVQLFDALGWEGHGNHPGSDVG
jgi:hypothetical protein